MKPIGCKLSYGEQRDAELYDEYKRQLPLHRKENGEIDNMAAIRAAVMQPCTRFWISEGVALHKIRQMLSEGEECLRDMIETKRRMYMDLMGVYRRLRDMDEYKDMGERQLAYMACDSPAKAYYMTPGSAIIRICEERRRRENEGRKKKQAEELLEKVRHDAAVASALQEARKGQATKRRTAERPQQKEAALKKWTDAVFRPRPLNWKIRKKARTALQYVIRWEGS